MRGCCAGSVSYLQLTCAGRGVCFAALPPSSIILSIAHHIATAEAIGVALTYGQLPKDHLEEPARARAAGTAGTSDFHELLPNEQTRFMLQAVQQHTKAVANADPPIEKENKEKKENKEQLKKERPVKDKKPGWLHKREYLKEIDGVGGSRRPPPPARAPAPKSERRSNKRSRPDGMGRTQRKNADSAPSLSLR